MGGCYGWKGGISENLGCLERVQISGCVDRQVRMVWVWFL